MMIELQMNTLFLKHEQSHITQIYSPWCDDNSMWAMRIVLHKGKVPQSVPGSFLFITIVESPVSPGYMFVHFLDKETDTQKV